MDYVSSDTFLGDAAFSQNDLETAQACYERNSKTLREIKDRNFLAYVVRRLGQLAWYQGRYVDATSLIQESLTLNLELADERGAIASLSAFAGIAITRGRSEQAARLFGAVHALLAARGIQLVHMDRVEYDRNTAFLRTRLDEKSFAQFWGQGRVMTFEQAVAVALKEAQSLDSSI